MGGRHEGQGTEVTRALEGGVSGLEDRPSDRERACGGGARFRKAAPCLHASSLAPTLCLLHSQPKTRFLFPRRGGKLFPTQSSLKSSGTPELVGKLEAGREEQGNLWKEAKEGSQVSAGREAQQGRQWQEAAQEAGARTPSGPLLSRCTPALSSWRTGRVWSTQGTVEAGRAEELKAASLGTSGECGLAEKDKSPSSTTLHCS